MATRKIDMSNKGLTEYFQSIIDWQQQWLEDNKADPKEEDKTKSK